MGNKGKAVKMVQSITVSYLLTAVMLLLLSFIMYKCKVSMSGANSGILASYVLSCLIGGFIFSGCLAQKKYLGGALLGVVYFAVVYLVSAVWNQSIAAQMPGMLTAFLICVFSGMLGGMIRSGIK
ncbi:MAG: TIGR04086 family membrane protein [Eubacterium sp.]|jgi:putative membrane protein (TIGR04086 family)|nr:TIGR04086 family membrane protein [Eubacterium sp.]